MEWEGDEFMEIQIEDLTKVYGSHVALDHVSLTLNEGIYGILGENGAGKSTLLNLLTDNLKRSSGSILLDGKDILKMGKDYRKMIGYMPQQQGFYEDFSALQFLLYIGELKGISRKQCNKQALKLLKMVNLYDVRHHSIRSYSGGMRQRILLAQALLGNPDIIILDEPSVGLDPRERTHMRNIISHLGREKIVLISTHIVSDVESIASDILLMKKGKIIKNDTPTALIHSIKGYVKEIPIDDLYYKKIKNHYKDGVFMQRSGGLQYRIVTDDKMDSQFTLDEEHINLEDVYLYYVQ